LDIAAAKLMAISKIPGVVTSSRLTTCGVVEAGQAIRLGFLDESGEAVSIEFAFEQTLSLIMTLPQLLSRAVALQTKDPTARCVFSLKQWTLERVDGDSLIITLSTDDGFAVSFSIPFNTCKALGFALRHEVESASEQPGTTQASHSATLN
jgi:hypothetical protein